MTVLLYRMDGSFIGPHRIDLQKGLPTLVYLGPLPGGLRLFMRHYPAHEGESARYDEVKPVLATPLDDTVDSHP